MRALRNDEASLLAEIKNLEKENEREIASVRTSENRITAMRIADFVKNFLVLCTGVDGFRTALAQKS